MHLRGSEKSQGTGDGDYLFFHNTTFCSSVHTYFLIFVFLYLYKMSSPYPMCQKSSYSFLRQRETEHEWGKVRERGRHRIWNRLQALSCQHRAWRGARTHGPRDRDLSWSRTLNRLSHPGAPHYDFLNNILFTLAYFIVRIRTSL